MHVINKIIVKLWVQNSFFNLISERIFSFFTHHTAAFSTVSKQRFRILLAVVTDPRVWLVISSDLKQNGRFAPETPHYIAVKPSRACKNSTDSVYRHLLCQTPLQVQLNVCGLLTVLLWNMRPWHILQCSATTYIQEKCRTMQLTSVCVISLCVFTCTSKGTPAMMLECNIYKSLTLF